MRSFLVLSALLVAPMSVSAAHAQGTESPDPGPETDEALRLRAIEVVGSRTDVAEAEAAGNVEVIDRTRIERSGARDLGEILEEYPGIMVSRSFRGDEILMQGLDPEYVLVLVDGIRVPGRIGGAIDLGRFTVEDIESVEIIRGPSSALYGSEAIAGVINIRTRRSTEPFELDLATMAGGGAGAVIDATGRTGVATDDFSARLSGGFHFADAFRLPNPDMLMVPDNDRPTAGSERMQWNLGSDLRWQVDPDSELDLRVDYLSRRLSGVDVSAGGAVFDRVQLADQLQVVLGGSHRAGRTRIRTWLAYSFFREQYLNDQRDAVALDDVQDNREQLGEMNFQLDQPLDFLSESGDHRLTVGYNLLFQELASERLERDGRRVRYSAFVQDDWTILDANDMLFVAVPGVRLDVDSQFGTQVSPKLALRFDPVPGLSIRASYGRGFRAPSFQELLLRFENTSVGYVVIGNPSLGAESSGSLQAGVDWTPFEELRLSANYFRNDVEGMITTITLEDSPTGQIFSYANIDSAYTQGLETLVAVRPIPELVLQASYVFTDAIDTSANRTLEGRAAHRITGYVSFDHPEWELGATARVAATGERPFYADGNGDGVDEVTYAPWYAQCDLRIWKNLTRHFEMFVGVDNLFDAGGTFLSVRPRTFYGGLRGRY
jgi:outer membrane receptor for ferrienterochelin and colicins